MRTLLRLIVSLLSAFLLASCATPQATIEDRIKILEAPGQFDVTVPKSRLILSFPTFDLYPSRSAGSGATASPRYFFLQGSREGLVVSGWFEPAERYTDLRGSWNDEMAGLRKSGFGAPTEVSESQINGMRVIFYNIPIPKGSSAHARCSLVRAGTWIDLHLSVSGDRPSAQVRDQLVALLNSISVREKP